MVELTLKWEKFGLSHGLHDMMVNQELVDVTIMCQGEVLRAHKSVMASCSLQFRQLFQSAPDRNPIVILKGVNLTHFKSILNFMYLGEATVSQDDLTDFLETASELGVTALSQNMKDKGMAQRPPPDPPEAPCEASSTRSLAQSRLVSEPSTASPSNRNTQTTDMECDEIENIDIKKEVDDEMDDDWVADPLDYLETVSDVPNTSHHLSQNEYGLDFNNSHGHMNTSDNPGPSTSQSNLIEFNTRNNSGTLQQQVKEFQDLLRSTCEGKIILSQYQTHSRLSLPTKASLCAIIIDHEVLKSEDYRIETTRFAELRDIICKIFPSESMFKNSYFRRAFKDRNTGENHSASGTLYSAYYNFRRKLRQRGVLPPLTRVAKTKPVMVEPTPGITIALEKLSKADIDPQKRLTLWKVTAKHRQAMLQSGDESVERLLSQYPFLTGQTGIELFREDFSILFPTVHVSSRCILLYTERLAKFASQLNALEADNNITALLQQYATLGEDTKPLAALLTIPYFVPLTSFKVQKPDGKFTTVKPTKPQMVNSFILKIETDAQLKEIHDARAAWALKNNLCLQPLCVVMGSSLDTITRSFVFMNNIMYDCKSPIHAFDTCYRMYHSLFAHYPYEGDLSWLFVQRTLYKMTTQWDRRVVGLKSLETSFNELGD